MISLWLPFQTPKREVPVAPLSHLLRPNERQPDFGKPQPKKSQAPAGSRKNCSSCDGGTIGDDSTSLINQELQSGFFTKTTKQGANNLDPISTPKPWLPSPSLWKLKKNQKKKPRKGAGPMDLARARFPSARYTDPPEMGETCGQQFSHRPSLKVPGLTQFVAKQKRSQICGF